MNAHRLASLAGIPITTAYRLARVQQPTRIDIRTIDKLCAALGCQPGDLFDHSPEKPARRR